MPVKLDDFPRDRGENKKIFELPPPSVYINVCYCYVTCIIFDSVEPPHLWLGTFTQFLAAVCTLSLRAAAAVSSNLEHFH